MQINTSFGFLVSDIECNIKTDLATNVKSEKISINSKLDLSKCSSDQVITKSVEFGEFSSNIPSSLSEITQLIPNSKIDYLRYETKDNCNIFGRNCDAHMHTVVTISSCK